MLVIKLMQLPRLSHLQFLVLGQILGAPTSGIEIRKRLAEFGAKKSGPAFYQLMARLEDGGLVEGWYEQQIIDAQIIRERHYKITRSGSQGWQGSRDFYQKSIAASEGAPGLAHG